MPTIVIDHATFKIETAAASQLRSLILHLAGLGYQEAHICRRLGFSDLSELRWRALPIIREEKLVPRDRLALAIDLFLLQGQLTPDELNQLFDRNQQELLAQAGLLAWNKLNLAVARASLFPVNDSLIFSDHAWPMLPHPGCTKVPPDQVMYVGTDSRWLARATVRHPVDTALDLCTGSGIHAVLAARHARRVVAVDINPRAVDCTRFNRQAAGAANIETCVGDLYSPVGGQRFDLITANPPFVPSPVEWLGYRDGGKSGEDVQRRLIAGLPQYLAPGGTAQIVTEFGEKDGENLANRLREWLGGAAMDIYVLRLREHSASSYAIGHAGNSTNDDTFESFLSSVQAWAANLRMQGYTRIVSVLLAFRWSDPAAGAPWTLSEESAAPAKPAGLEIDAAFAAERLVRRANFREQLARSQVRRAGPLALFEARFLGGELAAHTQVKMVNNALAILQALNAAEREVLSLLQKPMPYSGLVALAGASNLHAEAVFAALVSLIRRRLVVLD